MVPTEGNVPALSESAKEKQRVGSPSYASLDKLLGDVTRKTKKLWTRRLPLVMIVSSQKSYGIYQKILF